MRTAVPGGGAQIIEPSEFDFSVLNGLSSEFFADTNPSSAEWSCGRFTYQNGQRVAIWDRGQESLGFIAQHNSFDRLPTSTEKKICLTFTAGYDDGTMDTVLNTLKAKNVKAIFFLTGGFIWTSSGRFVPRIVNEGHIIGSHGDRHIKLPFESRETFVNEMNNFKRRLDAKLGYSYNLVYFRPPSGSTSKRDIVLAEYLGYKTVFWTFAYMDYDASKEPSIEQGKEILKTALFPGCILYLHSTSELTTANLGWFIDYARSQGYEFVLP